MTPFETLTGRRPNVAGSRVLGSRACALQPKTQQRNMEPRTDVGRFLGYTVGSKAYLILEDESNQVIGRRDVLMEENNPTPEKERSSAGPSVGPLLTVSNDGYEEESPEGVAIADQTDATRVNEYVRDASTESDDDGDLPNLTDDSDEEEEKGAGVKQDHAPRGSLSAGGLASKAGPRRSQRLPAPRVSWWLKDPKALSVRREESQAEGGVDLSKAPANEKEARARSD